MTTRWPTNRFKPLQAAGSFAGIPDIMGGVGGFNFGRMIEVQDGIPMDGSNAALRTYSPFLIRVVLPYILGGDQNTVLDAANPQRTPAGATVRSDNRDNVDYSRAQQDTRVNPSGIEAFNRMVDQGQIVDGITQASERSLEDAYNQAIFQQQFGPAVQNVTHPPTSNRTNTVTPAMTNDTTSLSLALQLKRLAAVPPLLMLINPATMKVDYAKVAQFQTRTRRGYQYEAWGEEMTKLSFTFHIGAYTAGRSHATQRGVVSGVQRASRNDSASYQQLQTLLAMYQGGTYIQDIEGNSRAFPMVGNLAIEYDQMVYVGHMENFGFGEEEGKPHGNIEISIDFVANRVFDVASPPATILPLRGPSVPGRNRGSLSRGGTGNSISFFTVPGVGGTSPLAGEVNQAWDAAVPDAATGASTGVDLTTGVVTTRRR